jgi:hypothetical protein
MTILLAAIALVAIALIVRSWRHRPFIDDTGTVPPTQATREHRWRQRLDAAMGNESEERLMLHAKGAIAKRRLLADLRNREERKRQQADVVAGVPVVRRKMRLMR